MLQTYLEKARALGFDQVGVLDVATLKAMAEEGKYPDGLWG